MRTVWKFPLRVGKFVRVPISPDAKIVLAAIDPASGAPAIWVDHSVPEVSPGLSYGTEPFDPRTPTPRLFIVEPTGAELDGDMIHHGSMIDRTFVWHVYERIVEKD